MAEWTAGDWRKREGRCYFEAGKNKEWRITIWDIGTTEFEITVHYRRAYQVFKSTGKVSETTYIQAKKMAEELFEEIKSSIND